MRLQLLAPLVVLAALLGCAESPSPPTLTLQSAAPLLLAGQATVVTARVGAGCQSLTSYTIETADGAPAPAWLKVKVDHFTTATPTSSGSYVIQNPGQGKPFDVGGGTTFDPASATGLAGAPGGREFAWERWDGLQLIFSAAAGAPAQAVALKVSMVACGESLSQPLALSVVGAVDLGAFCGWSSGESCGADTDCTRAGWMGQVCIASRSATTLAATYLSCSDPVPSGAHCGCTSGVCAWR